MKVERAVTLISPVNWFGAFRGGRFTGTLALIKEEEFEEMKSGDQEIGFAFINVAQLPPDLWQRGLPRVGFVRSWSLNASKSCGDAHSDRSCDRLVATLS